MHKIKLNKLYSKVFFNKVSDHHTSSTSSTISTKNMIVLLPGNCIFLQSGNNRKVLCFSLGKNYNLRFYKDVDEQYSSELFCDNEDLVFCSDKHHFGSDKLLYIL